MVTTPQPRGKKVLIIGRKGTGKSKMADNGTKGKLRAVIDLEEGFCPFYRRPGDHECVPRDVKHAFAAIREAMACERIEAIIIDGATTLWSMVTVDKLEADVARANLELLFVDLCKWPGDVFVTQRGKADYQNFKDVGTVPDGPEVFGFMLDTVIESHWRYGNQPLANYTVKKKRTINGDTE